ncbi:dispanin subfamily A member 2b-like isoform X2 [Xenopus tropicalis]|uniref:Dispanin subfamily A member 2b-like isoform X2 n=1 Tax=Xenopus tropicalis TaxID=8364 RepID=A0A8J1JIC8_XENTR|nr:dispanin subfamily A member 2b-like isoform X2 [Xenopus tropicalis]
METQGQERSDHLTRSEGILTSRTRHLSKNLIVLQALCNRTMADSYPVKKPSSSPARAPATELPVRDHLVWSIANTFCMNVCCLGLIAILFSVKSRDQKLIGNRTRAQNYGSIALALNITATLIVCSFIIFLIRYIGVRLR